MCRINLINEKKWLKVLMAVAIAAWLCLFTWPCLLIRSDAGTLAIPCTAYIPLSLRFIHSVQKTPVEENLVVDGALGGFVLQSTRYQSFGVGLPFLPTEGVFRREGDAFIMDGMGRRFPRLSLRTGVGTELTIAVRGEAYRMYEKLPPGSRVDLSIAPYFMGLW